MTIDREIKYSRASGDYDCFVDGRYIGSRPNYSTGEQLCNQVVYDLLADGAALTAAQLDGGADDEEIDIPDEYPNPTESGPPPPGAFTLHA